MRERKPGQGTEKRQRNVIVQYRTTPAKAEALQRIAADRGLSLAAYLREREEGSPGPRLTRRRLLPEERVIRELIGQIGYVGNNLNQLTRAVNAGDIVEPRELAPVLRRLHEIEDACLEALGKKP